MKRALKSPTFRQPASVLRFWFVVSAWLPASLITNAFAQTSSDVHETPITSGADHATIIVKRPPGLFGQGGERYLIDRGAGVVRNAIIVEGVHFPDNLGDFCIPRNIVYFLSIRPEALAPSSSIQTGSVVIVGRSFRANLEPNAALIGKFESRGILTWTRPPGRMRLEIVNVNGNQSVCAPVEVEAGKTYVIIVHYGDRPRFQIKVLPASKPSAK